MKILKSKKIDNLIEKIHKDFESKGYHIDFSEIADITIDLYSESYNVEKVLKIGEELNGKNIFKTYLDCGYSQFYFVGTEEEILQKINNFAIECENANSI